MNKDATIKAVYQGASVFQLKPDPTNHAGKRMTRSDHTDPVLESLTAAGSGKGFLHRPGDAGA